jgi:NAD-dependent dihydropyrimidine dehydrogenase PreA subunit
MPGMFIDVKVDAVVAADVELAKKLVEVCPVSIFAQENGDTLRIVEENLDECVLCDLCIEAAPKGSVQVIRLYDPPRTSSGPRPSAPRRLPGRSPSGPPA